MLTRSILQELAALHGQGQFGELESRARGLLEKAPRTVMVFELLAAALMGQEKIAEAAETYRQALEIAPDNAKLHHNFGVALTDLGRHDVALKAFAAALKLDPEYLSARKNLGLALFRLGRISEAAALFDAAATATPEDPELHDNLGLALQRLEKFDEAIVSHRRALKLTPGVARIQNNIGVALLEQGRMEDALASFREALACDVLFAEPENNIGVALEALGDMAGARAAFAAAVGKNPHYGEAHNNLSRLTQYQAGAAHIDDMQALLATPDTTTSNKVYFNFALSKALLDIGEDARGFEHLLNANRLHRSTFTYDLQEEAQTMSAVRAAFSSSSSPGGEGDQAPIFIVGMPRSGTTLVEQILASHADVFGAGELNLLPRIVATLLPPIAQWNAENFEDVKWTPVFEEIGVQYLQAIHSLSPHAKRVTDKLPLNFMWLGVIKKALPDATIIHCKRDPRDVCYSIFRKNFAGARLKFAYDLEEIGGYFRLYNGLMDHWRRIGVDFHDIANEKLIADQEGETRALLEYCTLSFDPACLSFEKSKRPVRTASAVGVRRPLNSDSVGGWRRFEKELSPLLATLDQ